MSQVITYNQDADPALVAKIEAARAKLKPACMRCRRNLTKKDLAAGRVCLDRSACTVRMIVRPPNLKALSVNHWG